MVLINAEAFPIPKTLMHSLLTEITQNRLIRGRMIMNTYKDNLIARSLGALALWWPGLTLLRWARVT